jgi:hypothetical protein
VAIAVRPLPRRPGQNRPALEVSVHDDGPGMPAALASEVLRRGLRLDESAEGQGIGLSVVSWFLVATPFIITALATAISMGVGFDEYVLGHLTEKFTDKKHKSDDVPVPNPSNTIE